MKFIIEKQLNRRSLKSYDAVFIPILAGATRTIFGGIFDLLDSVDQRLIKNHFKLKNIKVGESKWIRLNTAPAFVSCAAESNFSAAKLAILLRKFVRAAKSEGVKSAVFNIYESTLIFPKISAASLAEAVATNSLLANFDFSEEFKTKPKEGWKRIEKFILFSENNIQEAKTGLNRGVIIGDAVNRCRSLSSYPPGDMTPEGLAEAARDTAGTTGDIAVTVFDEGRLKSEGMNAILAVGLGSAHPPRLIIMEYKGAPVSEKPLVLVGKGVTFDSGGLNLKAGNGMADMHMDMSGGAAVICAMRAIATLKLPLNVVGLVPAAENMPSGLSYRQGDIIRAYGGKTIEIGNTDAEGRVILADAIEYAKTKNPELILTIATLTGASLVALGTRAAALFVKDNKQLRDALEEVGNSVGDKLWPLPLWAENEKDIEGNFADFTNTHRTGSRYGDASAAAAFLLQFAKPRPFAHVDMAPRILANPEEDFLAKGAAGFGVRFFVELAEKWEEIKAKTKIESIK